MFIWFAKIQLQQSRSTPQSHLLMSSAIDAKAKSGNSMSELKIRIVPANARTKRLSLIVTGIRITP